MYIYVFDKSQQSILEMKNVVSLSFIVRTFTTNRNGQ